MKRMARITTPTSETLLESVKNPDDEAAWERFYRIYSPFIVGICRQKGCSESVAIDVLQETMILLMRELPKFHYDRNRGKFRSYLYRILNQRVSRVIRDRQIIKGDIQVLPLKPRADESTIGIVDKNVKAPFEDIEKEWQKHLMLIAFEHVEERVKSNTWKSFVLHILDSLEASVVAERLGISESSVYTNCTRVKERLAKEIKILENEIGDY